MIDDEEEITFREEISENIYLSIPISRFDLKETFELSGTSLVSHYLLGSGSPLNSIHSRERRTALTFSSLRLSSRLRSFHEQYEYFHRLTKLHIK